jgi:ABC-type Na+ efflux pump permease subunit
MLRTHIILTLLYKEALRYRYNWGLLVMVVALLALALLVSIGARMGKLPGQEEQAVARCYIVYDPDAPLAKEWAGKLDLSQLPAGCAVSLTESRASQPRPPARLPLNVMAIRLLPPSGAREKVWKAEYYYASGLAAGTIPYREWFVTQTGRYLKSEPRLEEATKPVEAAAGERKDPVPVIITALAIFALYLLSFNLYITSTGEEREKRVMLGLLLSPATPAEVIAAKAIFYGAASLLLGLTVAGMYQPRLVARPILWSTVFLGSLSYVCIGTVLVSLIRRQTTISTVSMLYLIGTSIVMFLAQQLPLFDVARHLLVEDYLYRQMHQIIAGERPWWVIPNQIVLALLTTGWAVIAVAVFSRRGTAIAQAR